MRRDRRRRSSCCRPRRKPGRDEEVSSQPCDLCDGRAQRHADLLAPAIEGLRGRQLRVSETLCQAGQPFDKFANKGILLYPGEGSLKNPPKGYNALRESEPRMEVVETLRGLMDGFDPFFDSTAAEETNE